MGKEITEFNGKNDVLKVFDDKLPGMSTKINWFNNAQKLILNAMTDGVEIRDPENPGKKITFHADKNDTEKSRKIFVPGEATLREVSRDGGTDTLMMWYVRTHGVSAEDIIELVRNPDREKAQMTLNKIAGMKQDFYDLMTSNDPDRLADFYVQAIKEFNKDNRAHMMKIHDLESFDNQMMYALQWAGSGSAMQQSMAAPQGEMTETQIKLVNTLDAKLGALYGSDFKTRHMIALMNPCHTLYQEFEKIHDVEDVKNVLNSKSAGAIANYENILVERIACFKAIHDFTLTEAAGGRIMNPVSVKMAMASFQASLGINAAGDRMAFCNRDDGVRVSRMRLLAGDDSGMFFGDITTIGDRKFDRPNDPVGSALKPNEDIEEVDRYDAQVEINSNPEENKGRTTNDKVKAWVKGKNKADLDLADIYCYMSEDNPAFTEKQRKQVRAFRAYGDGMLRFSSFDPEVQCVLTSISHKFYHAEPQEYLSGALDVKLTATEKYRRRALQIEKGDSKEVLDMEYTESSIEYLKKMMEKAPVTVASSKEFKALDKAFKELCKLNDETQGPGNELKYIECLKKLNAAAEKYITEKEKSGLERTTDRGHARLVMARQMRAFSKYSVEGMKVTVKSLMKTDPGYFVNNLKNQTVVAQKEDPILEGREEVSHNNELELPKHVKL